MGGKKYIARGYFWHTKNFGMDIKIARYHNIYGPLGTYDGGREKAPAAICRKVALAKKEEKLKSGVMESKPDLFCILMSA